jgi:flagellar motility protein MotE (MotC chaperone)
MKTILKYWYLILLAFIMSLGSSLGLIYLRQDSWVPPEPEGEAPIVLEEGDSRSFREWRFRANHLEDLKLKLDAQQADLGREEKTLTLLRSQIETERVELVKMRKLLEGLRSEIEADYISIAAQELANLQRLASIYAEVGAEATVKVFEGLEDETVVKILSLMQTESSARILGAMGESTDPETLKRAAKFTADLRKVKQ